MKEKLKQIMSSVLGIDISEIPDDASQKNIPEWDSLQHLNLIVEIEDAFGLSFEPEQIAEMTTLNNIIKIISSLQL